MSQGPCSLDGLLSAPAPAATLCDPANVAQISANLNAVLIILFLLNRIRLRIGDDREDRWGQRSRSRRKSFTQSMSGASRKNPSAANMQTGTILLPVISHLQGDGYHRSNTIRSSPRM